MINVNKNPKGIKTNDCVIRAIAVATNKNWDDVYKDLCEIAFKKKRMPNDKQVYETYLERLGWEKHKQPRSDIYESGYKGTYKKYTVEEFVTNLNLEKNIQRKHDVYIITVAHHMTCVLFENNEYDIHDMWNCENKTIRNYWTKQNS